MKIHTLIFHVDIGKLGTRQFLTVFPANSIDTFAEKKNKGNNHEGHEDHEEQGKNQGNIVN